MTRPTYRARIGEKPVTVPVGRGVVEYPAHWTGPVAIGAAQWLQQHGAGVAEVWTDGEPPAPGQARGAEQVADMRVTVTDSGATFDTIEPPPIDAPAAPGGFEGAD